MISIGTRGIDAKCVHFDAWPASSIKTVAAAMLRYTWTPAIFDAGRRGLEHWCFADYVALDFDGEMLLADAIERFDGVSCIGTTRSHGREKHGIIADRFRVVLRLEQRCMSIDDYRETLRFLCDKYDTDPKCVDPAHLYFPCTEIVQVKEDGELELIRPGKPKPRADFKGAVIWPDLGVMRLTRDASRFLYHPVQKGERNTMLFRAAKDLLKGGLTIGEVKALLSRSPTQTSEHPLPMAEFDATVNSAFLSAKGDICREAERQPAGNAASGRAGDSTPKA